MEASAQEQAWQLGLAKQQQAAANETGRRAPIAGAAPAPATRPAPTWLQLATRHAILQPLATDVIGSFGVASLGVTWIFLCLYTTLKDFIFGISGSQVADPGDVVLMAIPPNKLNDLPRWFRDAPRIPVRLVIYPMGLMVCAVYTVIIFAMVFPYLMTYGFLGELIQALVGG